MRRYLIAILSLVLALPSVASAQWYLFPGGRPATDSTSVAPPTEEEITVELPYRDPVFSNAIEDDEEEATALTRVALILPIKSTGTPNSNFLDFYCGALMAADMLCSETHRYRVTVYDSTIGLPTADELDESDLVIGPVSLGDVETILSGSCKWAALCSSLVARPVSARSEASSRRRRDGPCSFCRASR